MLTPARKRLMRDFKRLQSYEKPDGVFGAPHNNDIIFWHATIFGHDTPWDEVIADGTVCADILENQWSSIYDVANILISVQSLLCDPNVFPWVNSEAARMFSENKREYNRKIREVVEESWEDVLCDNSSINVGVV